ncbi:hypothetical protein JCM6882_000871 [Rhodosporidiobolus microsporus]
MTTGLSTTLITYGLRVHTASLLFAVRASGAYIGPLRALHLILQRKHRGTLSALSVSSADAAVARVPVEVWDLILAEVRCLARREMRAANVEATSAACCESCCDESERVRGFESGDEGEELWIARGWFEKGMGGGWYSCEECLWGAREQMQELLKLDPAPFLASYGLEVVDGWPTPELDELESYCPTYGDEATANDALRPLSSVTLELLPPPVPPAGGASSDQQGLRYQIDTSSSKYDPPQVDAVEYSFEEIRACGEARRGLFAWLMQEWDVELVEKERGARPVLRVEVKTWAPDGY